MEPGHEDREYAGLPLAADPAESPQWSPVMKTGNTRTDTQSYLGGYSPQWSPVMKTGNTRSASRSPSPPTRLNGARS